MSELVINQKNSFLQLDQNKVEIIKSLTELNKIFDYKSLYNNDQIINIDNDAIIFFDTPTYNSAYLTDLINEYLNTYDKLTFSNFVELLKLPNQNLSKELDFINDLKGKIISQTKKTKFYYCQDEDIYVKLFSEYINNKFKTDKQVPVILTIKGNVYNKKPKDVFIDIETIMPLSYNTVMKNMVLLYDYNQFK